MNCPDVTGIEEVTVVTFNFNDEARLSHIDGASCACAETAHSAALATMTLLMVTLLRRRSAAPLFRTILPASVAPRRARRATLDQGSR